MDSSLTLSLCPTGQTEGLTLNTSLGITSMNNEALTGPCIVTKYIGPTNYRGTRIKATHERDSETKWSKTVSWDYSLDADKNHERAAQELIDSWPFNENFKFVLKGRGHDHSHYYFIADIEQEANS